MKDTILVVDDEQINVAIVVETFKDDFNVVVAYNGFDAIDIAKEIHPCIILLDINMPEVDGFEVAKKLKEDKETLDIPFLFLTSKDTTDSVTQGFEIGACDYVSKPFNTKELRIRVVNHIERYQTSKKLKELNEHLEKLVEEKSLKLFEKQKLLIQQSQHAAMGEMMDAIAHQWKQPLNAIKTVSTGLKCNCDFLEDFDYKSAIDTSDSLITEQVDHLTETIDEFRKFFRPNVNKETVNLFKLIESVIRLNKELINENKISVNLQGDRDLNYQLIKSEFKHVFINLINNAKDAFVENDIKDRIININITSTENNAIIKVSDNAGGIPDDIKNNIFDANFTTKEEGKGTGIGLYLVAQIIEKQRGHVSVANIIDGVEFTISLPL